jgi:hypothetical protein
MNARIGARPWVGWTHHDLACLLLRRGRKADRARVRTHLSRARAEADALGMGRLRQRLAELAEYIE